jgi:hypothetical protein
MTSVRFAGPYRQMAVILGTSQIASAIAVHLHRDRYGVVLSHDPAAPPVIRRKMAFDDALFDAAVIVDGVAARRADTGSEIRSALGPGTPSSSPSSAFSI